jgi:hypothetical protein
MVVLLLWFGCGTPEAVGTFVPLAPPALARRMSLDLRGVVPTLAELDRAESEGADALVEGWLADPRFESHLVDALAEDWLLRIDELRIPSGEFGEPLPQYVFARTFEDEPARLMARVAAEDRPWTEIVTADWTMVNDTLAGIVAVELLDPSDTAEWRKARYTDGRPAGGVVMTSGLWLRYHTTLFNYNRGRAAALSRYLLCVDYGTRPVPFTEFPGSSAEEQESAILTEEGCIACHASLDPLAGTLFGFWPFEDKDGVELVTYHPERERYGEIATGVSPAYFGTPVQSPAQLGPLIASDPRFARCAAERTTARLWGRSPGADELGEVEALRSAMVDGGFTMKALLRAVLATEEYRTGALGEGASTTDAARVRTARPLSTTTLASAVEELTGFRWTGTDEDLLDSDLTGYRVLLGGADGNIVRMPNPTPTVSQAMVLQRLAEQAGARVAAADLAAARAERRLIGTTVDDAALPPGDAALDGELTAIHRRALGVSPDSAELSELRSLYDAVAAEEGATAAWATVVSVLLRDPAFWSR